jgi:UDP-GlcNAc:undecaprenyl-phosphate GlcNAc-1-phosphate transferase
VTITNNFGASLILVTVAIATFIGISQLRYKEMAVLRNGVLLPMYEWPLMNSTIFQGFLDLGFIVGAFLLAQWLVFPSFSDEGLHQHTFVVLALVTGMQLLIFSAAGLYKGSFRQMGIGDLLKILKTVIAAIAVTYAVLAFLPRQFGEISFTLITLNFYFLLSFVVGARVSFLVLHYISRREHKHGNKNVLVYGADAKGLLIIQRMMHDDSMDYNPVGFLDDDPQLEGKRINGYPIFGGHWRLQRLVRTRKIDEVLIAGDSIKPEILRRLVNISRVNGITLRSYKIQLEEVASQVQKTRVQEQFVLAGK